MTEEFSVTTAGNARGLLLEREGVLAELGAALSQARNGNGRVVLVEGPAGIGKTRLLNETRERARTLGLQVLAARGGQLERGYGFGVTRQLLETAVASASPETRRELMSGAAVLAEPIFSMSAVAPAEADVTQRVLHGLYWLVANLAEPSPLLLAIDDVQWADAPSLRFLLYLAHRIDGMPVALAMALRTGDVIGEPELLRALRVEAHPPVIKPAALSWRAARTLASERFGRDVPDELVLACHAATRGNPFLLTELLHQLRNRPGDVDPAAVERMASERVAAAILLRVDRVRPSAAALVRAISVLGRSADLEMAAELADLDRTLAAELADALAQADIIEARGPTGAMRFVHPLVRSAIYEDMLRADRARLHARAAALLARDRRDSGAAAMHLLLSDPAGEASTVELLRDAARAAMARGAPETATDFLRRAWRERAPDTHHAELVLELGTAVARAGQPEGVQLLREAFRRTRGQPARARAGLELAVALGVSSNDSLAAIEVLQRAREGLEDPSLRIVLDARLVMFSILVPSARSGLSAQLREARAVLELPRSDRLRVLLAPLSADLMIRGAPAADVGELAEWALDGGDLARQDMATETDFALAAVASLISVGALHAAKRHLDEAVAHARTRGSRSALARLSAFRGLAFWRLGDLPAAESDAQIALSVDAAWGIPHAISTAVLAHVQIARGDLDGAQRWLGGLDTNSALLEVTANQIVREAHATLLMARDQPREALTHLRGCAHWEQQLGSELGLGPVAWRSLAAGAHLQLGEADVARDLAACELQLARDFGAPAPIGTSLRALAHVEGGDAGVELLEEAVAVLEPSEARLDHARAVVDLGAMLRRRGHRAAATATLREGMELAHRCAATALVDLAATQLRLAGARPRRIAVSGRASLTPGEHRVSDLASQGMSNKQIAQALFVTLRTVEMHLSNAYRKLGISRREELVNALRAD